MEKNMQQLNMDELNKVVGGSEPPVFDARREEFKEAWEAFNMEKQGISGMKRSEFYDEWEPGQKFIYYDGRVFLDETAWKFYMYLKDKGIIK